MNLLYNIAMYAYSAAAHIAALGSGKIKKMIDGQGKTFALLQSAFNPGDRPVWIHAASLGEFEQGRPLIEKIRRTYPNRKILLSFFSPSGYEIRKNFPLVDAVCYLPFDTPANAEKFVDIVNPTLAVFVKYEFWGNYLSTLKKRSIPTAIISSIFRDTQSFFKPYGGMFRNILQCYSAGIFVQDGESQRLLKRIGVESIVAGDTRFDRVSDILAASKQFTQIEQFSQDKNVIIVGSSWQPDEDIAIEYFNSHPEVKLILAPHEFNEERISEIETKLARKATRYSKISSSDTIDTDCLIIDCFGILSSCYRYATYAYIGGGFGVGIHNINEAAVYGIPVVFGPNYRKFKEACDLIFLGGAFSISGQSDFNSLIDKFQNNNEYRIATGNICRDYIHNNIGATDKIFGFIEEHIR